MMFRKQPPEVLYHAVLRDADHPWWRAMCGATPVRRSDGWSHIPGAAVTCPRCHDLLQRFESGGPRYQGLYEARAMD